MNELSCNWCGSPCGQTRRLVCYNILADVYADTEWSFRNLFPYLPRELIDAKRRHTIVCGEILRMQADIVCLQEVGIRQMNEFLLPILNGSGLDGRLTLKVTVACSRASTHVQLRATHTCRVVR